MQKLTGENIWLSKQNDGVKINFAFFEFVESVVPDNTEFILDLTNQL